MDQDQDDALYEALCRFGEANGIKHSAWSVEGINAPDLEKPHPYAGATHVVHWRCRASIKGGTWLDLWKAADKLIGAHGDLDHRFVEGFEVTTDDPAHLRVFAGS